LTVFEAKGQHWWVDGAKIARRKVETSIPPLYDGAVVAHWGDIETRYMCHSIRKSFLSALYGVHVAKGNIDLDETMGELGIDDKPPLTQLEKQASVRDLLKARSGVYHPAAYETEAMKKARPKRGSHVPGTFYYYNNWDFNTLGAIFEKQTGSTSPQQLNDVMLFGSSSSGLVC